MSDTFLLNLIGFVSGARMTLLRTLPNGFAELTVFNSSGESSAVSIRDIFDVNRDFV